MEGAYLLLNTLAEILQVTFHKVMAWFNAVKVQRRKSVVTFYCCVYSQRTCQCLNEIIR